MALCSALKNSCTQCTTAGCHFLRQSEKPKRFCIDKNEEKSMIPNLGEFYVEITDPQMCFKKRHSQGGAYFLANLGNFAWLIFFIVILIAFSEEVKRRRHQKKWPIVSNAEKARRKKMNAAHTIFFTMSFLVLLFSLFDAEWHKLFQVKTPVVSKIKKTTWMIGACFVVMITGLWYEDETKPRESKPKRRAPKRSGSASSPSTFSNDSGPDDYDSGAVSWGRNNASDNSCGGDGGWSSWGCSSYNDVSDNSCGGDGGGSCGGDSD